MSHPEEVRGIARDALALATLAMQAPGPGLVLPHLQRGIWTPIDASGAGLAIVVTDATWLKHENLVFARCFISYPITASGITATLGGLPFILDNFQSVRQGWVSQANVAALRYAMPFLNSTTAFFYDNAGVALNNVQLSNGSFFLSYLYTTP